MSDSFEASVLLHVTRVLIDEMTISGSQRAGTRKREQHRISLCIVLAILLCASLPARSEQAPLLAAASSLRTLWPHLSERYSGDTGNRAPRVSFASSGLLSTQIINGAPFEIFLSADLESIDRLGDKLVREPANVYALGELILVIQRDSALAENFSLPALAQQIKNPENVRIWRLAIPNPEHAPYGRAARDALRSVDLWPVPEGQLLAAENAAQTLQFIKTGAVDAALVPRSLLSAPDDDLLTASLPDGSYSKVEHAVVLLRRAGDSAREFRHWLLSNKSHALLMEAGFEVPAP